MSKIAVISTVRAAAKELDEFVNYHINIGIDEIIIFFDDPLDSGIEVFASREKVTTIVCTNEYWSRQGIPRPESIDKRQIVNANHGLSIAKNKYYDWVFHIDNDELIYPIGNMKDVLEDSTCDALKLDLLEAVPENENDASLFSASIFKRMPRRAQLYAAKILGCGGALYHGEYFRGHMESKMAFRVASNIGSIGIHRPIEWRGPVNSASTSKILLLHYDCVGFDIWKRKWTRRMDGSGMVTEMRNNRTNQYNEFVDAGKQGEESLLSLYRKLHMIESKKKFILMLLGMLVRISIDRWLFEQRAVAR